ncbi:hypothetical protein EVAR_61697_1 [Eumeta japonica]|uniref:Uncharacterized protein n=1 Tax=Eumeta variegata TaxID=151549 RepID=A0A4C1ZP58_EUMVA|nr:hypothetical protein EVAR_61697_1 [Eumeta japonica]
MRLTQSVSGFRGARSRIVMVSNQRQPGFIVTVCAYMRTGAKTLCFVALCSAPALSPIHKLRTPNVSTESQTANRAAPRLQCSGGLRRSAARAGDPAALAELPCCAISIYIYSTVLCFLNDRSGVPDRRVGSLSGKRREGGLFDCAPVLTLPNGTQN